MSSSLAASLKKRLGSSGSAKDSPGGGGGHQWRFRRKGSNAGPAASPAAGTPEEPSPARKRSSVPLRELEAGLEGPLPTEGLDRGSALSLTLADVLGDVGRGGEQGLKSGQQQGEVSSALGYFSQYLEARDAGQLLRFWLDVKAFHEAATAAVSGRAPPARSHSVDLDPRRLSNSCDDEEEEAAAGSGNDTDSVDSGFAAAAAGNGGGNDNGAPEKSEPGGGGSVPASPVPPAAPAAAVPDSNSAKAVRIYQEYLSPECPSPVNLPSALTHDIIRGICSESGVVSPGCFQGAREQVFKMLEADFFPDFLRSEGHAKHQVDVLTSGRVGMLDLLSSEALIFNLMEFLDKGGSQGDRNLLEFWMSASNFRKNSKGSEYVQQDAVAIYERFVGIQATNSLGVSDGARVRTEEAICSEAGVRTDCFDHILALAVRVLEDRHLEGFLDSQLYRKYLQELLCQIQTGPYHGGRGKVRRSNSGSTDASNASSSGCYNNNNSAEAAGSHHHNSISSHNTLLAMSKPKPLPSDLRGRVLRVEGGGEAMDALSDDPDAIWRRGGTGGAGSSNGNIGVIDSVGRYRSRVDPLPGLASSAGGRRPSSVSSKLGRAMRKLVNTEVTEAQEEMAWQMADMLVREVMEVTSPTSLPSTPISPPPPPDQTSVGTPGAEGKKS